MDLADLQNDYGRGRLLESNVDPDPFVQFRVWLDEVVKLKLREPYAMTLATASSDGMPSARMVLLRGFAKHPGFPTFDQVYGLKAAAVAAYPMYRGLASLLGMNVLDTGASVEEEFRTVAKRWNDFNFFYVHVKKTDTMGEDGNFDGKVHVIEEVDSCLPLLTALKPDVLVLTGDHSTPATYQSHSWHPVPTLLASAWCRGEASAKYGERDCRRGVWGEFHASSIMPEALGHAGKLARYGA